MVARACHHPNGRDCLIYRCCMLFTQISDIHLSIVNNLAVAKDLTYFCSDVVQLVSPSLVLVTGDLTHAKFSDERWSQQFEEEWRAYAGVLERTRVREKCPWLDIRGNHGTLGGGWNFETVHCSQVNCSPRLCHR